MRYCICGNTIMRRQKKGGREKEYCSKQCRQKAYRERHKGELSTRRASNNRTARMLNKLDQEIHRESWQDDLEQSNKLIKGLLEESSFQRMLIDGLQHSIEYQERQIAEKDVEIVRLQSLLDQMSKRKR